MAKQVKKETSPKVATIAAKLLQDPKSSKKVKTVAASSLSQAEGNKKRK